jgi:hypothetical protein
VVELYCKVTIEYNPKVLLNYGNPDALAYMQKLMAKRIDDWSLALLAIRTPRNCCCGRRNIYCCEPLWKIWLWPRSQCVITGGPNRERRSLDLFRQDFNMPPWLHWNYNETADRSGINEMKHIEGNPGQ